MSPDSSRICADLACKAPAVVDDENDPGWIRVLDHARQRVQDVIARAGRDDDRDPHRRVDPADSVVLAGFSGAMALGRCFVM